MTFHKFLEFLGIQIQPVYLAVYCAESAIGALDKFADWW